MNIENIDGTIEGNVIVSGHPEKNVSISRGVQVSLPAWENTSQSQLHEFEREMQTLLRLAKPGMKLQISWQTRSDFDAILKGFYDDTRNLKPSRWSQSQRDFVFTMMSEAVSQNRLRCSDTQIYLSKPVEFDKANGDSENAVIASAKSLDMPLEEITKCFIRPGGSAHVMTQEDLVSACHRYFVPGKNGNKQFTERLFDPQKTIFQNFLGGEFVPRTNSENSFFYNGHYYGFVAMRTLPQETLMGMMAFLCALPVREYGLNLCIEPLKATNIIEYEENRIAKLKRSLRGGSKHIGVEATIEACLERVRRLSRGDVIPFKAQLLIRSHAVSLEELHSNLASIQTAIYQMNGAKPFALALPTSCRNAFFACMPGSAYDEQAFKLYIEDLNLAHLCPVSGHPMPSSEKCEALYHGSNHSLHVVNTFGGAKEAYQPLHTFVTGTNGSGKSCLINDLLTQTEPYYDYTVIIDNGLSYATYTKTFPGNINTLILSEDGEETLNFLSTHGQALDSVLMNAAVEVVELMASDFVAEASHKKALIFKLVSEFYMDWSHRWQSRGEKNEISSWEQAYAYMSEEEQPTFSNFHDWFKERLKKDNSLLADCNYYKKEFQDLLLILERWRRDRGRKLFDGKNTINLKGKLVHLELSKLNNSSADFQAVATHIITHLISSYIETLPRGQHKRIVFEELGAFLLIPKGKDILRGFYERSRKFNTVVISVIQQISLLPADLLVSIIGNCKMAFLFRQKFEADARQLQKAFRLPESAVQNLLRFPAPSPEQGAPFLHWISEGERTRVVTAYSIASPEMLYVSSSSGEHFDQKNQALKDCRNVDEVLEVIRKESR